MEHAVELHRPAGVDAERDDVLDLEVDLVADAHAVAEPVVLEIDPGPLDAEELAHHRGKRTHRAAQLTAEDLRQLVGLLVRGALVDEHAEPPVPVRHHLRRVGDCGHAQAADVGAVDLPLLDVEHQRDAAVVVRGPVVERQVAGAHQLARARLDVVAAEVPGHDSLPGVGPPIVLLRTTGVNASVAAPGLPRSPPGSGTVTPCGSRPGTSTPSSSGCRDCCRGWTSGGRTSSACRRRSSRTTSCESCSAPSSTPAATSWRRTASRPGTGSRSCPASASRTWSPVSPARPASRIPRRAPSPPPAPASASSPSTCRTGASPTPTTTGTSCSGSRRCATCWPPRRRRRWSAATSTSRRPMPTCSTPTRTSGRRT